MHARLQWFDSWQSSRPAQYLALAVILAIVGVAHEALAAYRAGLARQARGRGGGSGGLGGGAGGGSSSIGSITLPLIGGLGGGGGGGLGGGGGGGGGGVPLRSRLQHSALYVANLASGYLLMLAVMSYNAGFFAVVVLSMGAGHFLFFSQAPWHLSVARGDACCETATAAHE